MRLEHEVARLRELETMGGMVFEHIMFFWDWERRDRALACASFEEYKAAHDYLWLQNAELQSVLTESGVATLLAEKEALLAGCQALLAEKLQLETRAQDQSAGTCTARNARNHNCVISSLHITASTDAQGLQLVVKSFVRFCRSTWSAHQARLLIPVPEPMLPARMHMKSSDQ